MKVFTNYLKYLLPSMILPVGLILMLAAALVTLSLVFLPQKANQSTQKSQTVSYKQETTQQKPLATAKIAQANTASLLEAPTTSQVKTATQVAPAALSPSAQSCKIGSVGIEKSKNFAPSEVIFTVKGSRGVNYYHISYKDSYSVPGHNSGSGANIARPHLHLYSHPGQYQPVLYAYKSLDAFKAHQACDVKILSLTIKQTPEVSDNSDSGVKQKNGWQWPAEGKITSIVGMRVQPVTHVYRMHQGIDIANKKGTRINAARDGKVIATRSNCRSSASDCGGGYGNYVVLRHSNGLYSIYAHLSKLNAHVGEKVLAGEKIGEMGNTGLTHEVHLHFGIGPTLWVNQSVKDPLIILPKR